MARKIHLLLQKKLVEENYNFDFSLLPRSYKRVGHIALINLHEKLLPWKYIIAENLLTLVSSSIATIARFTKPISGEKRYPAIEWLAGHPSFETEHKELNTTFIINAQKIMLSAGNHFERKRLIQVIRDGDIQSPVILDMFACIGNLSLPIAKHIHRAQVIALEINPEATEFLKKSLILNKIPITRFKIILGDNRKTCPENIADYVIMGYFEIDKIQLTKALNSLKKNRGGKLFIHGVGNNNDNAISFYFLKEILNNHPKWNLISAKKREIKTISPTKVHYVYDCKVGPK
ncbi:MAG: hypothetical protein ACXAC7_05390 [Candidatus Hodarchaeales archaeon]|jgi:tRNA G37 N-methylase Trm5